ncbi:hypothetical protein P5673_016827 [Acropora cervicornis]|uniref:Uncharacterized protein n=1 Tax=Acropora cervicornis TaxID=6130 RepID=A0AAD9QFR2_ACRCE|nr:hypothetical protein P5673_016827 [Acropora cervicornis]
MPYPACIGPITCHSRGAIIPQSSQTLSCAEAEWPVPISFLVRRPVGPREQSPAAESVSYVIFTNILSVLKEDGSCNIPDCLRRSFQRPFLAVARTCLALCHLAASGTRARRPCALLKAFDTLVPFLDQGGKRRVVLSDTAVAWEFLPLDDLQKLGFSTQDITLEFSLELSSCSNLSAARQTRYDLKVQVASAFWIQEMKNLTAGTVIFDQQEYKQSILSKIS